MKKMNVLMEELGFKKDAPDSVKEAFIKHLIKAATGVNTTTPSEKKEIEASPEKFVQLSFGFISPDEKAKIIKKAVS